MRDLCDGDDFSQGKHPLFSVNLKAIQLIIYYDDFEVANPLGAKAVVHKIGWYLLSVIRWGKGRIINGLTVFPFLVSFRLHKV